MIGLDRIKTALWALPLLAAALVYLPAWGFACLLGVLAAVGQWELYRFHFKDGLPTFAWGACLAGFFVVAGALSPWPLMAVALGAVLILVLRLTAERPMKTALLESGIALGGLIYVAGLLAHMALLRGTDHGIALLFFVMLVTWTGDAAAYYVGSKWGRRKLTHISPNKTVEGTLGGIAASVVAAYLGAFFVPGLMLWTPLVIGLVLGVLALLGDLVESMFKRGAGVKDSSHLIPGHGGVMDKLDAFLFTAPGLYYLLALLVWSE